MFKRAPKEKIGDIAIAFLVATVLSLSYSAGLFRGLENLFEDRLVSPRPVSSDIVIIAIDSDSINQIGQWPWRRSVWADLLTRLNQYPPQAVGIDAVFAETSSYGPADDVTLATTLLSVTYPVILPVEAFNLQTTETGFVADDTLLPKAEFLTSDQVSVSHVNLLADQDGVVRRYPRTVSFGAESYDSFSLSLARLGGYQGQTDAHYERIVFAQAPGGIKRIPFSRILTDDSILPELAGKVVLIGATSPDLHDEQLTPVSNGIRMPGVEIQANIVNMLLSGYVLGEATDIQMTSVFFIIALLTALVFLFVSGVLRPVGINLVLLVVYIVGIVIKFDLGYVVNFVHIFLTWLITLVALVMYRYFLGERGTREIRQVFSRYVSKSVLDEILKDPKNIKLGGEEDEVTILFSDIRGFTTLSEKMTPTELTEYLNRYLTVMTDVVLAERGLIDKYIGDAIMAFWGAPLKNEHHALDAVQASLKMIQALDAFNAENRKLGEPEIKIGIGLNTGLVVAGNMGSRERLSYTLMGDAVNLASRLESLTKQYGVGLLVGEEVIKSVGEEKLKALGLGFRKLDKVKVKGKNQGVNIYEITNKGVAVPEAFVRGQAFYEAGEWSKALAEFVTVENDGPTKLLKERCEKFLKEPPEGWVGVYEMTSK